MTLRTFVTPSFTAREGMSAELAELQRRLDRAGSDRGARLFELQRAKGRGPWFTVAWGLGDASRYMRMVSTRSKHGRFRLLVVT